MGIREVKPTVFAVALMLPNNVRGSGGTRVSECEWGIDKRVLMSGILKQYGVLHMWRSCLSYAYVGNASMFCIAMYRYRYSDNLKRNLLTTVPVNTIPQYSGSELKRK